MYDLVYTYEYIPVIAYTYHCDSKVEGQQHGDLRPVQGLALTPESRTVEDWFGQNPEPLQGYLARQKTPNPLKPPRTLGTGIGSYGEVFPYERGTPVIPLSDEDVRCGLS